MKYTAVQTKDSELQPPARPRRRAILLGAAAVYVAASAIALTVGQVRGVFDVRLAEPQFTAAVFIYWLVPLALIWAIARWRLWRKILLACLSGIMVPVVLMESLGRAVLPQAAQPQLSEIRIPSRRLHHSLLPNSNAVWSLTAPVAIRTNEDGLRTDYSRSDFLKHDPRIAILGDSFTFGYLVPQEKTIPAIVEDRLRKAGLPGAAVLNAGFIAYSPMIERQFFHDVVSLYHPSLTLLLLDVTDIGDDFHFTERNAGTDDALDFPYPDAALAAVTPPPSTWITLQLLQSSGLFQPAQWLSMKVSPKSAAKVPVRFRYYDFKVTVNGVVETNRDFILKYPLSATRHFFERTFHFVRMIRNEVEKTGSRFVLVLLPRGYHWNNNEAPDDHGRRRGFYTGEEPHRFVFFDFFEEATAREKMTAFNLLPAFKNANRFPLCYKEDSHYNADGNEVAGTALADFILKASPTGYVP